MPTNLLAQLTTNLLQTTEALQNTSGTCHMEDQLSETSDLPGNRQELPPAIVNIPPPLQLNPQQTIPPPHPAITVNDTNPPTLPPESTSHRTPLLPVPPRTLDKIQKGEYIDSEYSLLRQCLVHQSHRHHLPLK